MILLLHTYRVVWWMLWRMQLKKNVSRFNLTRISETNLIRTFESKTFEVVW